jgi:hypothetical protein
LDQPKLLAGNPFNCRVRVGIFNLALECQVVIPALGNLGF